MLPRLHYFNPGHEAAVLAGTPYYTPPANVRRMSTDLSFLPAWYAEVGDSVLVSELPDPSFLSFLRDCGLAAGAIPVVEDSVVSPCLTRIEAMPWGLSPQSLHKFTQYKRSLFPYLEIQEWQEVHSRLIGRESSAACLRIIKEELPDMRLPKIPLFLFDISEVEEYIASCEGPVVLKMPYSSSGRGLLWLRCSSLTGAERNWIAGALKKQRCVSVEPGLDKLTDFAMEFYADGRGDVRYEGLSLFSTHTSGAYSGNLLDSQESLFSRLTNSIEPDDLLSVQRVVTKVLRDMYAGHYRGYLGVDMLLYKDGHGEIRIHPCVEVNMRYTMGLVASRLYQSYVAPCASGTFVVSYDKDALSNHLQMKEKHPLYIEDGRVCGGYLSLCPVTEQTCYSAYMLLA